MEDLAIDSILERIRHQSARFPDEQRPHHFSFDFRSHPERPVEVVVLGLNPGESKELAPLGSRHAQVLEESSRINFQESAEVDGSSKRWKTRMKSLLGERSISYSNMFFWSSRDSGKSFKGRFKAALPNHELLGFCASCNLELIEAHKPKLVMVMGLSHIHRFAPHYRLTLGNPVFGERGRLAIPLHGRNEPWLAVKHPTGARLSNAELALAKERVETARAVGWVGLTNPAFHLPTMLG